MKRFIPSLVVLAAVLCLGAVNYFYTPLTTGFTISGGTSSTGTLAYTSAGTATLSGTGAFNLTNFITSGSSATLATATVSILKIGGSTVIDGSSNAVFASLTANSLVVNGSGVISASGDLNIQGANATIASSTFTLSGIPASGAAEFLGRAFDGSADTHVVGLSIADAATMLGVSDYHIKQNIMPLSGNAADVINALVPVTYNYTGKNLVGNPNNYDPAKPHTGFIAQSVSAVIANAGTQTSDGTSGFEDRAVIAWLVLNQQQMMATISAQTVTISSLTASLSHP